jgi:hypothetical protein
MVEIPTFEPDTIRSVKTFQGYLCIKFFKTRLKDEVSKNIRGYIENILQELNEKRRRLNRLLDDIKPWQEFISRQWFDEINRKISDYNDNEFKLNRQLSELLLEIGSGTAQESKILRVKNDFNEHLRSLIPIENFFAENGRIKTKIETLMRVSPKRKELLIHFKSIEDFLQDFYDGDLYFLHICEQWQIENEENSSKQMRYFIHLKETEEDSGVKFWVIDHNLHLDLKDKPKGSVIYYATNGSIISQDFYEYSSSKFIIVEMKLEVIKE